MTQLKVLDLFSGMGGASQSFVQLNHKVIRMDICPGEPVDILADIRFLPIKKSYFDLIWASPPCTEFTRSALPWFRNAPTPSMELVCAAKKIIDDFNPKFWVIENVKGSIPFISKILGAPTWISLPYVLWGNFPPLFDLHFSRSKRIKSRTSGSKYRSRVHKKLSDAMCSSMEQWIF